MRRSIPDYDEQVEATFFRRLPSALTDVLERSDAHGVQAAIAGGAARLLRCEDAYVLASPPDDLREAIDQLIVRAETAGPSRAQDDPWVVSAPLIAHGSELGRLVLRRHDATSPFTHQERGLLRYYAGLSALALESVRLRETLEALAYTDPLTGLANRRRLLEELQRLDATGKLYSLLVLDVDGLKEINDTLSYELGDTLLIAVARALEGQLREGDLAVRLGGDEYIALLPRATRDEERSLQERVLDAVQNLALPPEAATHYRGASVGIVRRKRGEPAAETMKRAAAAMREHKRSRR